MTVPYLFDQTLLSISRCSRTEAAPPDARKESGRSQIVATATIRVAHVHVDKPHDSIAMHNSTVNGVWLARLVLTVYI